MQTKILIKDEVNVTLQGLDLTTRKNLVKKFSFELPYARHLPAVRLGRWDGKVSFFTLGGSSYINLLPDILAYLDQQGYEFELHDQRDYRREFAFEKVAEDSYSHKTWPVGHPDAGQPIKLRDYQVEIINKFIENPQALQEVATGAGKTIMTATMASMVEKYGRSIVIVPNKDLVKQTAKDYLNCGLDHGVYFGDKKDIGKMHTICTWQSLNSLLKQTKEGKADIESFIEDVVCVIVDEVHQAKADVLKELLTGVFANVPLRWGLTGTIPKSDWDVASINSSIGKVIHQLSAKTLQDEGVLSQCHVEVLQTQETAEYNNYQSELKFLLEDKKRADFMAAKIMEISKTGNTLVLVDRLAAGQSLVERLPAGTAFVSGKMKSNDRQDEYDDINQATNSITVATYGVAAVGLNIPRIFNLVMIEPGKSFVRVIQSIGRGVRKAKDKDFVQIWDFTSRCKFSKRHLTERKKYYKEAQYPYTINKVTY